MPFKVRPVDESVLPLKGGPVRRGLVDVGGEGTTARRLLYLPCKSITLGYVYLSLSTSIREVCCRFLARRPSTSHGAQRRGQTTESPTFPHRYRILGVELITSATVSVNRLFLLLSRVCRATRV